MDFCSMPSLAGRAWHSVHRFASRVSTLTSSRTPSSGLEIKLKFFIWGRKISSYASFLRVHTTYVLLF